MTYYKLSRSFAFGMILIGLMEASIVKAGVSIPKTSASSPGCEEIRHLYLNDLDNMMLSLSNNLDHISEANDLAKTINEFVDSLIDFRAKEEKVKAKYPELFVEKRVANWKVCNLQQAIEQKNDNEWEPTKEALNNAVAQYKTNASVLKANKRLNTIN